MIRFKLKRLTRSCVKQALVPLTSALCLLAAMPSHATVVNEAGDAGHTLPSAQATVGLGPLFNIRGSLSSSTDADLFLIRITDVDTFSATTVSLGSPDTDTQLFLFDAQGAAIYGNDDLPDGSSLLSSLPAGHPSRPLSAGLYYVGVSFSGYDPVNANGQSLFRLGLSTDIRIPDSNIQPLQLAGFDGSPFGPDGSYDIQFTGASVSAVPEPATGLMFLAGGLLAAASLKRRRATAASAAC